MADLAGISVRALRHYDELGLLRPSGRSDAGWRLYAPEDLNRLQQVLFYRELGFGLTEIRDLMADPRFDRREALVVQRGLIVAKTARLKAILDLIDKTLASIERGMEMSKEEIFEVFGDFDPAEYEEEVKERWGDTEAYKESARRTAGYTKEDWQRIKDEGEAWMTKAIELFDNGTAPDDPKAKALAEEARLAIDRNFYPCSRSMHMMLGEGYVSDPRFTEYYDKHRSGLAKWFNEAIKANAAR